MTFFDVWFSTVCPAVPLSRPIKAGTLGTPWGTLENQGPVCMLPCSANDTVGWHTAVCRLLFHGLSSFSCPANSSACLASPAVPLVPSVPCCPTCPIVPFSLGRDSGTPGTASFLSSLLRWIIRLTVDLPQLTCEAISRTDFPDWDSCRIRQSLCHDSLSPGFFRCSFSVE